LKKSREKRFKKAFQLEDKKSKIYTKETVECKIKVTFTVASFIVTAVLLCTSYKFSHLQNTRTWLLGLLSSKLMERLVGEITFSSGGYIHQTFEVTSVS
jgi:hypothetical protein